VPFNVQGRGAEESWLGSPVGLLVPCLVAGAPWPSVGLPSGFGLSLAFWPACVPQRVNWLLLLRLVGGVIFGLPLLYMVRAKKTTTVFSLTLFGADFVLQYQ
jgi:hypothetical protein